MVREPADDSPWMKTDISGHGWTRLLKKAFLVYGFVKRPPEESPDSRHVE